MDKELKDRADILVHHLRYRLKQHLQKRIKNKKKRKHWTMKWANRNLPVVSAYMTMFNHAVSDIECVKETESLLSNPTNNFVRCSEIPRHEGAYLYWDSNKKCWCRSGKVNKTNNIVSDRVFEVRDGEHKRDASAKNPVKYFYKRYPTKDSPRAQSKMRDGYFENLEQYAATAFESNDKALRSYVDKDYITEEGLLLYKGRSAKGERCAVQGTR